MPDGRLGARIEQLRGLTDLSARELDALAGLRAGHTRFIELDQKPGVEIRTIQKIATVFGCSLDWLYRGIGAEPKPKSVRGAVAKARASHEAPTGSD